MNAIDIIQNAADNMLRVLVYANDGFNPELSKKFLARFITFPPAPNGNTLVGEGDTVEEALLDAESFLAVNGWAIPQPPDVQPENAEEANA
jgi:hypothetical protein